MTYPLDYVRCVRRDGGDGVGLDDHMWQDIDGLDLVLVHDGAPPAFPTRVRLLCTGEHLWVRFDCAADAVTATMTRYNDKVWQEDAAEVFIWPPGDEYLYEFQLSPRGIHRDLRVAAHGSGEQTFDDSWRCDGLRTEAAITYCDGRLRKWHALFGVPRALFGDLPAGEPPMVGLFRITRSPVEEFSALRALPDEPVNFHDNRLLVPLIL